MIGERCWHVHLVPRACATLALIALIGCDALLAPEIQDCERYIKAKLRSPSTYQRISARSTAMPKERPPQVWAVIEYDAANAYGTPIRDMQICTYPTHNGRADVTKYVDHDAVTASEAAAAASSAASEAEEAAKAAISRTPPESR